MLVFFEKLFLTVSIQQVLQYFLENKLKYKMKSESTKMLFICLEVYEHLLQFDLSLGSLLCTFLLQGSIVSTVQLNVRRGGCSAYRGHDVTA
jgi:hypothetical protein